MMKHIQEAALLLDVVKGVQLRIKKQHDRIETKEEAVDQISYIADWLKRSRLTS